jgi:hypothetical protein
MKKDSGAYGINPRARTTSQAGDGESFAFNGQMGDGVNRGGRQNLCDNMYSIGDGALSQNYGRGPTVGNASSSFKMGGPNPNKTIATAAGGGPIVGTTAMKSYPNPDRINVGLGPRKGNR